MVRFADLLARQKKVKYWPVLTETSAARSAPQSLCFRSKSTIRSFVGIGVAPGTIGALRNISNFRNSKSSLIASGNTLALSIGNGFSALTMMTPASMAKNAPRTRHLMKSDQTPKPPRCQSGVSSITGELAALGGNVSAGRRIGVWAFARSHQFRGDLLLNIAVSESTVLVPLTPIRRPADTFPLPAAHFER